MDCDPPGSSVHAILQREYWRGLPFPSPEDLPNPGAEAVSLMSPVLAGKSFTTGATRAAQVIALVIVNAT